MSNKIVFAYHSQSWFDILIEGMKFAERVSMKVRWLSLFCFVFFTSFLCAQTSGEELYSQGLYKKALDVFMEIEPKDAALWYNIGNCHYYLAQFPQALVAWRRAQRISDLKLLKDISYNLAVLQSELGLARKKNVHVYMYNFIEQTSRLFPVLGFQLLFLCFLIISFFTLMYSRHRWVIVLCALSLFMLFFIYKRDSQVRAVVMQSTSYHAGPADSFPLRGMLEPAREVVIAESDGSWYKLCTTPKKLVFNGVVLGWAKKRDIEKV